jgi:hypothetical protein
MPQADFQPARGRAGAQQGLEKRRWNSAGRMAGVLRNANEP